FRQLTAFEQAEMILYAALDPSVASRASKGESLRHAAAGRGLLAACQATEPLRAGAAGEWRPGAWGVSAPPGERTSRACGAGHAGSPQHQWEGGQGAWYGVGAGDRWQRPFEIPSMLPLLSSLLAYVLL